MIFGRKRGMVDVRELHRRGVVRLPKQDIVIPTDQNGFVELGENTQISSTEIPSPANIMNLLGESSATTTPTSNREESERVTELDNKIYKLEQRIELLEKKLEVNQPTEQNLGVMGW